MLSLCVASWHNLDQYQSPRASCSSQMSFKAFSLQFIQPPGTPPTEVLQFALPPSALPWLHAVAYYLRQNLLIFLHTPKYTDSNVEHHFKVRRAASWDSSLPSF